MGRDAESGRPSDPDARTTGRPVGGSVGGAAVLAVLLPSWIVPLPAFAAGRVALVVGNSDYEHVGRLPNPANDAADVGAALRRLGFEVTVTEDAGLTALTGALRAFTRDSEGADVALVFYAGHGMEMDGVNYLLPVDARLERDTDVRYETVTLDDVLASTSGAELRLVILDACRNNPLARSMRRTARTRNVSNGSLGNLNEDLLGDETLVAYSAAAGTTADDGEGRNSPYASALLAHLEDPVDIGVMFRRVRARVLSATNERQRPHEYSSLLREHSLGGAVGGGVLAGPTASSEAALPDPVLAQQETVFWQSAANSTNAADAEAYLARWPNGTYAVLARNRLAALRAAAADPPRPNPPAPDSARPGPPRPVQLRAEAADPPRPDPPLPDSARPSPPRPVRRAGEVFRDCDTCPEMVTIPAGTFMMGSPAFEEGRNDREGPQHRVTVSSFALGETEVTFDEWEACVRGGGCDGYRPDDEGWGRGARPVINVNWEDAWAYVRWLSRETGESYRLPSEAEWEYAARAGTTTSRHWGDSSSSQCGHGNGADASAKRDYSFMTVVACDDGAAHTTPVGSYSANRFGLFDVLGNVWEWTEDCWHENYRGAPADGSPWYGGDCGRRVLRGGSWLILPRFLRSAARYRISTVIRVSSAGFRVARTLD